MVRSLLVLSCFLAAGCSSTTVLPSDAGTTTDASLDGSSVDASADSAAPENDSGVVLPSDKKTWGYIYAAYFGPGSLGHCGNSGCHQSSKANFLCGPTKDTCYQGLVKNNQIGSDVSLQRLIDPSRTSLSWFNDRNGNGSMPQDNPVANETAADEITAWVAAGAPNN